MTTGIPANPSTVFDIVRFRRLVFGILWKSRQKANPLERFGKISISEMKTLGLFSAMRNRALLMSHAVTLSARSRQQMTQTKPYPWQNRREKR